AKRGFRRPGPISEDYAPISLASKTDHVRDPAHEQILAIDRFRAGSGPCGGSGSRPVSTPPSTPFAAPPRLPAAARVGADWAWRPGVDRRGRHARLAGADHGALRQIPPRPPQWRPACDRT